MPDKLTDKELIKAMAETIDHLQAENERLKGIKTTDWLVKGISKEQLQEEKIQALTEEINRQDAEIERLRITVNSYKKMYEDIQHLEMKVDKIKAEAYKEFADRLKETFPEIDWLRSTMRISSEIDNLLKELVGVEK